MQLLGRLTDYSLHGWQYLAAPYVYMHRHVTAEKTGVADQIAHWALTFFEALPGLNFIVALIDAALGRKAVTALPSESGDNPVEEQQPSLERQSAVGRNAETASTKEDPAGPPASDQEQLPQDEGAAISQAFRMRPRKHRRVHYQHLAQAIQQARARQQKSASRASHAWFTPTTTPLTGLWIQFPGPSIAPLRVPQTKRMSAVSGSTSSVKPPYNAFCRGRPPLSQQRPLVAAVRPLGAYAGVVVRGLWRRIPGYLR